MSNFADMAKFRVSRSADILYVQFYVHVVCNVETKILAEKEKEISLPPTEMVVGLVTGKDLEDEHKRRASILSLFQFAFQHPYLNV